MKKTKLSGWVFLIIASTLGDILDLQRSCFGLHKQSSSPKRVFLIKCPVSGCLLTPLMSSDAAAPFTISTLSQYLQIYILVKSLIVAGAGSLWNHHGKACTMAIVAWTSGCFMKTTMEKRVRVSWNLSQLAIVVEWTLSTGDWRPQSSTAEN